MAESRKPHLVAGKSILKYIKSTSDMGLLYGRDTSFNLHGFTDADYWEYCPQCSLDLI
ncbi:hypothetical protein KSP40_PGU001875 [Platanthera guangdongensis]|uniref:Uncharacterized protein n=1 Tax=Platanthera guangdongensis TaxID=2320717 RepID=A0ABR2MDI7_9ASPA